MEVEAAVLRCASQLEDSVEMVAATPALASITLVVGAEEWLVVRALEDKCMVAWGPL